MKIHLILFLVLLSNSSYSQDAISAFIAENDKLLSSVVNEEGSIDYQKASTIDFTNLSQLIEAVPVSSLDIDSQKAFYINAYNTVVIRNVAAQYPISSVKDIPSFFEKKTIKLDGNNVSLNDIENKLVKPLFENDPRYHFVLVCGAIDCPKIATYSYDAEILDAQLEDRCYLAMNDENFLKKTEDGYALSEIFKWNSNEFGSREALLGFINQYVVDAITTDDKISYYTYNWALNSQALSGTGLGNNQFRYISSSVRPKGRSELKIFNNLYSQNDNIERANYLTTTLSYLYGSHTNLNIGISSRLRKVGIGLPSSSPFDVFSDSKLISSQARLSSIGPQVRWAPSSKWRNFSIQSTLLFALSSENEGTENLPFLDWNGPILIVQFWNDMPIGNSLSLFTDVGISVEDFGFSGEHNNSISLPMTAIFSYFPVKNWTIYTLGGVAPFVSNPVDYFYQAGLGTKYQFSPNFEIELLYTYFSNRYLHRVNGQAATYNIGFRYSN